MGNELDLQPKHLYGKTTPIILLLETQHCTQQFNLIDHNDKKRLRVKNDEFHKTNTE